MSTAPGLTRRIMRPLIALALGAAVLLIALPASASAAQTTYVQVGPIKVHGGYTVTLTDSACGAKKASDFSVTYTKGSGSDYAEHTYVSKAIPECRVTKSLGAASVNVKWAKALDLSVTLTKPGKVKKGGKVPAGCKGSFGSQRAGTAHGRIDLTIHTKAFGTIKATKAPEYVSTSGTISCKTPKPANAYNLDASFGQTLFLSGTEDTNGKNPSMLVSNSTPDTPAKNVTGSYLLSLSGKAAIGVGAGKVNVNGLKGFTTGSLVFTALPACTSTPNAYNGTFSGTLTVLDPVFGNFGLVGSAAKYPTFGLNADQPGDCNGPLYQPVAPLIDNTCSTAGLCQAGQGDDFNDGTTAGNNTIQSETINFGDGTAPQAITPGGSIVHNYAANGTYTATVTVTYITSAVGARSQTTSASTPVHIGT